MLKRPRSFRFSDIFGRKGVLLGALAIFLIGSLGSGLSQNITELIIFRAIGGIGNGGKRCWVDACSGWSAYRRLVLDTALAGVVSLVMIVVSDVVALRDRGKYQG